MASCKDCLSYDVCQFHIDEVTKMTVNECRYFKDRNRFVELPCKVGDKVYFIKHFFNYAKQPMCGTVCMIRTFTGKESWTFGVIMDGSTIDRHFVSNDIGKTVFLTKEEAEQALKEREKNG